jgi:hypothetical protein
VPAESADATDLRRWFSEDADIRNDVDVAEEVLAFITDAGARSVVMTDRIIGCPHEEGIDYEGPTCPKYPFWAGRDRWTFGDVAGLSDGRDKYAGVANQTSAASSSSLDGLSRIVGCGSSAAFLAAKGGAMPGDKSSDDPMILILAELRKL